MLKLLVLWAYHMQHCLLSMNCKKGLLGLDRGYIALHIARQVRYHDLERTFRVVAFLRAYANKCYLNCV